MNMIDQPELRMTGDVWVNQRFGGVSRYGIELARHLRKLNRVRLRVCSPLSINHYLAAARRDLNYRGIQLSRRPRGLDRLNHWISRSVRAVSRRPDIVHEMFYNHHNLDPRVPVRISTFYDMIHEKVLGDDRWRKAKLQTAAHSERCIAISEATKRDMVEILDMDEAKIDVVHLATDIASENFEIEPLVRQPFVLWVGERRGYKNFDAFIDALGKTSAWRDTNTRLVLAGGPSVDAAQMDRWRGSGVVPDRVMRMNADESQLAWLYRNAIFLAYPSRYEGFGIPPLEAMVCECPVMTTHGGSLPEVVGDAALIVDPDDVDDMKDAIERLIGDEGLRRELVIQGQTQAKGFSWQRCAEETLEVYQKAA